MAEKNTQLNGPSTYACYYGPARLQALAKYDWVIVEPAHYTPEQVAFLRSRCVRVIAYLSLGLERASGSGGGWHLVDPGTGQPLRDPRWNTFLVDPRSPAWQRHILHDRIPEILGRGFQGVLLDNLDYREDHSDTRPAMINLVQQIRHAHPELTLVANRGFSILDSMVSLVNAVLFEAFTTYHDGHRYAAWEGDSLTWTGIQAARLRTLSRDWPILALDYAAPRAGALRRLAETRARALGFVSFDSTWSLDWLPDAPSGQSSPAPA